MLTKIFLTLACAVNLTTFAQQYDSSRYDNGKLKAEGLKREDGSKAGEWKYYYPSGILMSREHFKNGVLDGHIEYYYPSGILQGREQWTNGLLEDSASYYFDNGALSR